MPNKLHFLLWQRTLFTSYFSARCWYLFSMMLGYELDERTPVCPLVFCSLLCFFPLHCNWREGRKSSAQHRQKLAGRRHQACAGRYQNIIQGDLDITRIGLLGTVPLTELLELAINFKKNFVWSYSILLKCVHKKKLLRYDKSEYRFH